MVSRVGIIVCTCLSLSACFGSSSPVNLIDGRESIDFPTGNFEFCRNALSDNSAAKCAKVSIVRNGKRYRTTDSYSLGDDFPYKNSPRSWRIMEMKGKFPKGEKVYLLEADHGGVNGISYSILSKQEPYRGEWAVMLSTCDKLSRDLKQTAIENGTIQRVSFSKCILDKRALPSDIFDLLANSLTQNFIVVKEL